MPLNETHDPKRRSWVASANEAECDFPIQNLPFGIFRHRGRAGRGGVAIGDRIFDLKAGLEAGLFSGAAAEAAKAASGHRLNPLMALGSEPASALRARLSDLLRAESPERGRLEAMGDALLVPMAQARIMLPAAIGDFTDFFTSIYHVERGSRINRPDGPPVPPNFKYLPIAYHSRASSVVPSGAKVVRPNGQSNTPAGVRFGACQQLDFELEVGAFIGPGNKQGEPFTIKAARGQLFGYCLLNDWSARDIQRWETNPLGPFLGKSFATTISPWVVTDEAMMPFRAHAFPRAEADPPPMDYLKDAADEAEGLFDLALDAYLLTARMRAKKAPPARITETNFKYVYWSFAQMATHHASNGCNLVPGDLLGSGTASGPTDESRACLLEATVRGSVPLTLPDGETRAWLEDGDEVIFRARARREGYVPIGFGECRGRIEPAPAWPAA